MDASSREVCRCERPAPSRVPPPRGGGGLDCQASSLHHVHLAALAQDAAGTGAFAGQLVIRVEQGAAFHGEAAAADAAVELIAQAREQENAAVELVLPTCAQRLP